MRDDGLKSYLKSDIKDTPSSRIVRILSERGSLSSAQIARLTSLARSTVSTAVTDLKKSGLILETEAPGRAENRVGRPGTALTLNPEAGTVVGAHLGHNELRVAVADVSHSFICEQTIGMPRDYGLDLAAQTLKSWIDKTYPENGLQLSGILGVGVSVSAPVAPEGTVHRSSIVPTWAGTNLDETFSKALGTMVLADNESNCSAIAEMMWGAAQGYDNFMLLKLTIGVGGAIVVDGRIVKGVAGGAGEFGHVSIDPNGTLCSCGNRGCFETYASTLGPMRELSRLHEREISEEDMVDLVLNGDAGARRVVSDLAETAGRGLAMFATILNPPLVLISGSIARAGPAFFNPLISSFEHHTMLKSVDLSANQRTRIIAGQHLDNDVVLGAVGLILRHHLRVA